MHTQKGQLLLAVLFEYAHFSDIGREPSDDLICLRVQLLRIVAAQIFSVPIKDFPVDHGQLYIRLASAVYDVLRDVV